MPSKTSKPRNKPSLWKAVCDCSETELLSLAADLSKELKPGDRVLLEGSMGVGKTTFARALLKALGIEQPPEGSPTFAIAHEYHSASGEIIHIDFYRLKSEAEIDDAGIPAYFWERELIVISEWLSSWPEFEKAVVKSGRVWRVDLTFSSDPQNRSIQISFHR